MRIATLYPASLGEPPVSTRPAASAVAEYSQAEERLDPFDQFQSLPGLAYSSKPAGFPHGQRESGGGSFPPSWGAIATSSAGSAAQESADYEHNSSRGQEYGCCQPGLHPRLKTQQRILLLEGDLRRPSLSQMFGIGRNPGLCEWLEDDRSLATSVYHLEGPNIWILPAGSAPSNALELLQSARLSTLMDQLTALFDWIIIDSPPVLPLADTSVWMRLVDGILLTTRQGTTEKQQLQRGLEAVESKKLIGALVNSSKHAAPATTITTLLRPFTVRR